MAMNERPLPSPEDLARRLNRWVQEAMIECEVANFEWEWHQAQRMCDEHGCEIEAKFYCSRCGR